MADFISGFWNMYVMVIVALSLLFCVFVLVSNMTKRESGPVELHGHVWDETLAEYNNPLPRWWMYLFWITIAFAVVYLSIYPGFGKTNQDRGEHAQYEAEMKAANEKYGPIFAKYRGMDLAAVAADPEAKAMGQRMFLTYCAQCHGSDAGGSRGFPNLRDSDWLYGGDPATIKASTTASKRCIPRQFSFMVASPWLCKRACGRGRVYPIVCDKSRLNRQDAKAAKRVKT